MESDTAELAALFWASAARGEFEAARGLVEAAAATDAPEAHQLLATLCFVEDDFPGSRAHLEQAFRKYRAAGDFRAAVRIAARLASLHVSTLGNRTLGRGWIGRGQRLLDQVGRCVEEGYLALALVACEAPDISELEPRTGLALELALEYEDPDLEVRALAESGFALAAQGRTTEGFARLDEAMAALTSAPIVDWITAGESFCALLSACDRTGDAVRAQEWTAAIAELFARFGGRPKILHTHCRIAYGSVLCAIGRWDEAEAAMLEALSPAASKSVMHRAESSAHLADLRVLQGRLEEAAALLAPYEDILVSCAPLARLHLARGEPELAAAAVDRALAQLVADRVREIPLLALRVEIELTRANIEAARRTAVRLREIARRAESPALRAEAALAEARVEAAAGEYAASIDRLLAAQRLLDEEQRPILSGMIHAELASALDLVGRRGQAVSEARAALALFERLGSRPHANRVAALLRSLGETPGPRSAASAAAVRALSRREAEVLALVRQGLTNAEIGERLYISAKTVEHHVSRILTKLGVRSRAEAVAVALTASSG